jgi:hypothetical protein
MWPSKIFLLVIISFNINAQVITENSTKKLATEIAFNFYNTKNSKELSIEMVKSPFKNSTIIRSRMIAMNDLPIKIFVIDKNQKHFDLPIESGFKAYSNSINQILSHETINLKNTSEAEFFVRSLFNIYGIFKSDLKCENSVKDQAIFRCQVKKSEPKEFNGNILLKPNGEISL